MTAPRKVKHVPMRRCVVCRQSLPQADLFRLSQDSHSRWQFDVDRRAGGRGAWLCKLSNDCHEVKALKRFFQKEAERIHKELRVLKHPDLVASLKGG